jgi:hypothetical protein
LIFLQHIDYAKSKSYATLKREDPLFVPPNSAHANSSAKPNGRITISSDKRQRDDDVEDGERQSKREKTEEDDEEEMEIDEDEESGQPSTNTLTSGTSLYLILSINHHFTTFHWKHPCLLRLSNHRHGYYARICHRR